MAVHLFNMLKKHGIKNAGIALWRTLFPPRCPFFSIYRAHFSRQSGIEIGGPSFVFSRRGLFPLYCHAKTLDNVNFSAQTLWEGRIAEGRTFRFNRSQIPGKQYLAEASSLTDIPSDHYDYLASSDVLEHTANPIKALREWMRIIKPGGIIVLALPHRDGTFDHRRPITTMDHLIEDFRNGIEEDDLTHLDEILRLHDLTRDPLAGDAARFRERSLNNIRNRALHHHVFDTSLAWKLAHHAGLNIEHVGAYSPYQILLIGKKLALDESPRAPDQATLWGALIHSPFPTDRARLAV